MSKTTYITSFFFCPCSPYSPSSWPGEGESVPSPVDGDADADDALAAARRHHATADHGDATAWKKRGRMVEQCCHLGQRQECLNGLVPFFLGGGGGKWIYYCWYLFTFCESIFVSLFLSLFLKGEGGLTDEDSPPITAGAGGGWGGGGDRSGKLSRMWANWEQWSDG